jgi:NAD(P)-dependent dehydrogenase (short-subunit alcohol dehydrogenase family)
MNNKKTVVITGAGTGIGKAIAFRLAADGMHVALMARDTERLRNTAQEIEAAGGSATVHACDIRDKAQVDDAFLDAATTGPIHGLVANSGIGGSNKAGDDDRFMDLIQTNLVGTYHTLRAAQRHMAAGPDTRHLVVISSILGRIGVPYYTGYCASKTALLGLVRALAQEVAGDGIQVNAICPGWVDTEMAWEGIDGMAAAMGVTREEAHKVAMSAVPAGRMSKPDHIAGTIAWLISTDATGVTGQAIDINGGAWMG